jgi:hypothetical protein
VVFKHIFPLPPLEKVNQEHKLDLTQAQYERLLMVYDDYMTYKDLRLFDELRAKYGLYKAGEKYAKLMVKEALQMVLHSP